VPVAAGAAEFEGAAEGRGAAGDEAAEHARGVGGERVARAELVLDVAGDRAEGEPRPGQAGVAVAGRRRRGRRGARRLAREDEAVADDEEAALALDDAAPGADDAARRPETPLPEGDGARHAARALEGEGGRGDEGQTHACSEVPPLRIRVAPPSDRERAGAPGAGGPAGAARAEPVAVMERSPEPEDAER